MSEGFYRFTAGLPTQAFRAGAETGVTHFGDCPLGSERFAPRDSGGRSMPAKQNLKRAHDELFRRGPGEVSPSLQALYEFCQGEKERRTTTAAAGGSTPRSQRLAPVSPRAVVGPRTG